ncbi:hypothetical protein BC829DRAFT_494376 [Chytridium lagenaria]|nr:hypothetical protein BC829DRAFT_494376 [Chytridium lagenaria]
MHALSHPSSSRPRFLTLPTTNKPPSRTPNASPQNPRKRPPRVQDAITNSRMRKTCFSTVTGYTNPMTLQSLRVVCTDKKPTIASFAPHQQTTSSSTASACAFRTCPTTDFGITRSMLSQLPIVCYKFSPAEFPIAGAPKSDAPEVSVNTMMVLAGWVLAMVVRPLSPTGLIHIEEIEPLLEHPSLSFIAPSDRQDFLRFLIQNHAQLALCYYKSRGTDEGVYKASNIPTPEEIKLAMDSSIEPDVEVSAATETLARASSEPSVEWAKKRVEKWKRMKKEAQEELESWEKEEKMFLAKLHRIAVRVSLMRRKVGMLEKRLMEG